MTYDEKSLLGAASALRTFGRVVFWFLLVAAAVGGLAGAEGRAQAQMGWAICFSSIFSAFATRFTTGLLAEAAACLSAIERSTRKSEAPARLDPTEGKSEYVA